MAPFSVRSSHPNGQLYSDQWCARIYKGAQQLYLATINNDVDSYGSYWTGGNQLWEPINFKVPGRQHLRSARSHQLSVPRVRRSTFGTRAFSVPDQHFGIHCLITYAIQLLTPNNSGAGDLKTYLFAGHAKR